MINIVDVGTGVNINPALEVKAASPEGLGSISSVNIDAATLFSLGCICIPEFDHPAKTVTASVNMCFYHLFYILYFCNVEFRI